MLWARMFTCGTPVMAVMRLITCAISSALFSTDIFATFVFAVLFATGSTNAITKKRALGYHVLLKQG